MILYYSGLINEQLFKKKKKNDFKSNKMRNYSILTIILLNNLVVLSRQMIGGYVTFFQLHILNHYMMVNYYIKIICLI